MARKPTRLSYFSVLAHLVTGGRAYRGDADSPAGFLKLTTTGRSLRHRTAHPIPARIGGVCPPEMMRIYESGAIA